MSSCNGAGRVRADRWGALAERHPWLFALALLVTIVTLSFGTKYGYRWFFRDAPIELRRFTAVILRSGAMLSVVIWLGWSRKAGLTGFPEWRSRYLLWWILPFALITLVVSAAAPAVRTPAGLSLTAAYVVLVAFNEEVFCRGLVQAAFAPKGPRRAILIQGGIFGLVHSLNVFSGFDPGYVVVQVLIAGLLGVFLGALRLRLNAIWPAMAVHALIDFGGLVHTGYTLGLTSPRLPAIVGGLSFYGVLALIAILLLARTSKVRASVTSYQTGADIMPAGA